MEKNMHQEQRIYALDNIRTLMVLFIVLLHACCAYAPSLFWWHAQDGKHLAFEVTLLVLDSFCLPVLFFIAGLFAKPSYDRHGLPGFIKGKLQRLGGPVLLLSAFYMPAMVYQGYLRRSLAPESFFAYWTHWMSFLTDWKFVAITTMAQVDRYQDSLSPHPLWFMSMLLIFFLLYALLRYAAGTARLENVSRPAWPFILAACAGMTLGFALINTHVQVQTWAKIGPFILFQPTRVPIYALAFALGVWLRPDFLSGRTNTSLPGPLWAWLAIFLGALLTMLATASSFMRVPGPAPVSTGLAHGLLRSLIALSATVLFLRLGGRFLEGPSRWRESLAAGSYDIYILHMPLVVFAQAALVGTPLPLALKMLLSFSFPVALCWAWSRATARRPLRISLAGLGAYFGFFCLLY